MKGKKFTVVAASLLAISLSALSQGGLPSGDGRGYCRVSAFFLWTALAYAEDDWKKEFEDLCSKTEDAMSLTKEELRVLISRCDSLRARIEKLDGTQKKVYLRRLQLCKDLYLFVLESKEKN